MIIYNIIVNVVYEETEMKKVYPIISKSRKQAQKMYKFRHYWAERVINWELCKLIKSKYIILANTLATMSMSWFLHTDIHAYLIF